MSRLASEYDAINLGQGFPDYPAPEIVTNEAIAQIMQGNNQYAPGRGLPELRQAIVAERSRRRPSEQVYDPDTECLVTVGATEAITAAVLGLLNPGEHVVLLEPFYDSYRAAVAMAGAQHTSVPLRPDSNGVWQLEKDELAAAITPDTTMLIINTPHNPTGALLSYEELSTIAELCVSNDVIVLSDEVYERLVFEGEHQSIVELPGMRERTVVVGSGGKTFNTTGWKTGWALAPAELLEATMRAKQYLSYVGTTPTQPAIAKGLEECDDWVAELCDTLRHNRDLLSTGLRETGATVYPAAAGYFVIADVAAWGFGNAEETCQVLAREHGVVAIPVTAFVDDPTDPRYRTLLRFGFCKDRGVIEEGLHRLAQATRR